MELKIKSDFLFASPSGIAGVSRLLDWGNTFDSYNVSGSTDEADLRAATSDWTIVGDDLYDAMMQVDQAHGTAK